MTFSRLVAVGGGLALGLSSCLKEPEYSTTPAISFNDVQVIRIPVKKAGEQRRDSIRMTINYQDGDGDLGLSQADQKLAPFKFKNPDSTYNKFNSNFFVEIFIRNSATGKYELRPTKTVASPAGYNGAFPRLTTETNNKPLKGTVTYATIPFGLGDFFQPRDSVRFEISIADRALHVSNTITTRPIYIAPR